MRAETRHNPAPAWTPTAPTQKIAEKKRLLVVDDQGSLTKIVGAIAADAGFEVRTVNDPNDALDVFVDYRPDILILDMVMPEKDGVDVLNEIMLTGIDTRIILTSGFTDSYVRLALGVAAFHNKGPVRQLRKPFRREQLLTTLREAVAEAAGIQAVSA